MDTPLISSMEHLDMDSDLPFSSPESDLASEILARYQNSPSDDHHHLCAAVGAMAQALKDESIPQSPVAFFAATVSSLDRLSRDPNSGSDPATSSLLGFLAMTIPRVSPAVVRSKWDSVAEMLVRVLGFGDLPVSGVKAGLKCVGSLVKVGEKGNWAKVSAVYGVVLGFITDPRPKVMRKV